MNARFRKRLYAAQQRLAITGRESAALLGLSLLLLAGFSVRYLEARGFTIPHEAYAELDAAVADSASRSVEEALRSLAPVEADTAGTLGEPEAAARTDTRRAPASRLGPVRMNLNTAPPAMLERLPGIGPALAGRIVEHREAHGPFRRPEDITAVRGIGPKTYEKLAPFLYVD